MFLCSIVAAAKSTLLNLIFFFALFKSKLLNHDNEGQVINDFDFQNLKHKIENTASFL